MTDKELIELAAKAAGYVGEWKFLGAFNGRVQGWYFVLGDGTVFNPLDDDGDALRLAVKLGISIVFADTYVFTLGFAECTEMYNDDPGTAARRAIVRVAAEIGKEQS